MPNENLTAQSTLKHVSLKLKTSWNIQRLENLNFSPRLAAAPCNLRLVFMKHYEDKSTSGNLSLTRT